MTSPEYKGFAVNGPAVGRYLAAPTQTVLIPTGGAGNRGFFGAALYKFADGEWRCEGEADLQHPLVD